MGGDLCIKSGCNLQDFKQFQQFFWTRRLRSPRDMFFLEKDWEEAKKKGVVNPQLEQVYMESKAKLEIREAIVDKNIMNVVVDGPVNFTQMVTLFASKMA